MPEKSIPEGKGIMKKLFSSVVMGLVVLTALPLAANARKAKNQNPLDNEANWQYYQADSFVFGVPKGWTMIRGGEAAPSLNPELAQAGVCSQNDEFCAISQDGKVVLNGHTEFSPPMSVMHQINDEEFWANSAENIRKYHAEESVDGKFNVVANRAEKGMRRVVIAANRDKKSTAWQNYNYLIYTQYYYAELTCHNLSKDESEADVCHRAFERVTMTGPVKDAVSISFMLPLNPLEIRTLARLYDGHTVTAEQFELRNPEVAFRLNRRLAHIDHPFAVEDVAEALLTGNGISPNVAEAISWLELGVEKGFVNCMVRLSNLYSSGKYVPADEEKANKYMQMAVEKGYKAE